MKIAIIGGGPSGLFLSILLKERMAGVEIDVYEQNPEDATFGFGVVLADTGLSNLRAASPVVVDELAQAMRFSDRHSIVCHEHPITMKRPGAGGGAIPASACWPSCRPGARAGRAHRLPAAYRGLRRAAGRPGGRCRRRQLAARAAHEDAFGTTRRHLSNHFARYGVEKPFPNPALVFRKHQGGYFVAHYYPYSDTMSTFVAECDHQTGWTSAWKR